MREPAPLIALPNRPAPKGAAASWVMAKDGVRLRVGWFPAEGAPRGSVVLSPGRTEPIEKYFEVIQDFTSRGFVVLCHDWRGQGLSQRLVAKDPMKGEAQGWRPFLADLNVILAEFSDDLPKPWLAVGHSMGGGLTLLALAEGETRFAATVLSAPMAGVNLAGRGRGSMLGLARLLKLMGLGQAYAIGRMSPFADTFETQVLTHDRGRWQDFRDLIDAEPSLALFGPTWNWIAFALELSIRVEASPRIDQLATPLAILAAEDEKLVDNAAAEAVARRAPQGAFSVVGGAYHEILMETEPRRAQFFAVFDGIANDLSPVQPLA